MPSFSNKSEIKAMKSQMRTLVDESWFPGEEKTAIFQTDEKQIEAQGSDDYFLESASRIHFFAEKEAMDDQNGSLKKEYAHNKVKFVHVLFFDECSILCISFSSKITMYKIHLFFCHLFDLFHFIVKR